MFVFFVQPVRCFALIAASSRSHPLRFPPPLLFHHLHRPRRRRRFHRRHDPLPLRFDVTPTVERSLKQLPTYSSTFGVLGKPAFEHLLLCVHIFYGNPHQILK